MKDRKAKIEDKVLQYFIKSVSVSSGGNRIRDKSYRNLKKTITIRH